LFDLVDSLGNGLEMGRYSNGYNGFLLCGFDFVFLCMDRRQVLVPMDNINLQSVCHMNHI
jgi:hypothetical protein